MKSYVAQIHDIIVLKILSNQILDRLVSAEILNDEDKETIRNLDTSVNRRKFLKILAVKDFGKVPEIIDIFRDCVTGQDEVINKMEEEYEKRIKQRDRDKKKIEPLTMQALIEEAIAPLRLELDKLRQQVQEIKRTMEVISQIGTHQTMIDFKSIHEPSTLVTKLMLTYVKFEWNTLLNSLSLLSNLETIEFNSVEICGSPALKYCKTLDKLKRIMIKEVGRTEKLNQNKYKSISQEFKDETSNYYLCFVDQQKVLNFEIDIWIEIDGLTMLLIDPTNREFISTIDLLTQPNCNIRKLSLLDTKYKLFEPSIFLTHLNLYRALEFDSAMLDRILKTCELLEDVRIAIVPDYDIAINIPELTRLRHLYLSNVRYNTECKTPNLKTIYLDDVEFEKAFSADFDAGFTLSNSLTYVALNTRNPNQHHKLLSRVMSMKNIQKILMIDFEWVPKDRVTRAKAQDKELEAILRNCGIQDGSKQFLLRKNDKNQWSGILVDNDKREKAHTALSGRKEFFHRVG